MYVLESHPELTGIDEVAVYFVGSPEDVSNLNRYLVAAGLGAVAAGKIKNREERLVIASAAVMYDGYGEGFPNRHLSLAGLLLGDESIECFDDRRVALTNAAAYGHMTEEVWRKQLEDVEDIFALGPGQWLTHQGYCAEYRDGRIEPTIFDLRSVGLSEENLEVAARLGVNHMIHAVQIEGNTNDKDARPRIVQYDLKILGTPDGAGGFMPRATYTPGDIEAGVPGKWQTH